MKKKIFAISDMHGHYTETIKELNKYGWDSNNEEHLLVVCGDMFDRGTESLELFLWLKELTEKGKAVVVRGNHEKFLEEWLSGPCSLYNWTNNGFKATALSFATSVAETVDTAPESYQDFFDWSNVMRKAIIEKYPNILEWLNNLPYYYETKNHIFTHGNIQTYGDWRNPRKGWDECTWDKGFFFGEYIFNTEKNIVVGHFDTGGIRERYKVGDPDDYSVLIREDGRIIMLDACTVFTKQVNVYTLEKKMI